MVSCKHGIKASSCPEMLLDEALAPFCPGTVVLVKDCVETSGAFILYHLIKYALFSVATTVILVGLSNSFFHYDRILRKLRIEDPRLSPVQGFLSEGWKWDLSFLEYIRIHDSPHNCIKRSYYRCTNPRCSAKKQVERSTEDPETLIITYEGLHLHFTYSHFLLTRPSNFSTPLHPTKRPKIQSQDQASPQGGPTLSSPTPQHDPLGGLVGTSTSEGLLEDVVPLVIRDPLNAFSNERCEPFHPPSPSSPSSISWSPNSSFDVGILSSIG